MTLGAASLKTRGDTAVGAFPAQGSKRIGTVVGGARVRAAGVSAGDGCVLGWVQLEPRGYVCGDLLDMSPEPPWSLEQTAQAAGLEADAAAAPVPQGYMLADHAAALPLGVVVATGGAPVWRAAAPGRAIATLPYRSFAPVLEIVWAKPAPAKPATKAVTNAAARRPAAPPVAVTSPPAVPEAFRIGDDQWISARHARLIEMAPLPMGYRDDERWIDINLETQVLTAYEGILPVFATLVSTGVATKAEPSPTPTGVFRVWKKVVGASWSQILVPETGVGLIAAAAPAATRMGVPSTRGAIALAPADAAWLFRWTSPAYAPGWIMSAGVIESPGTPVQVRSARDPKPALQGYAIAVYERDW